MHGVTWLSAATADTEDTVDITWVIPVVIFLVTVTGMVFLARTLSKAKTEREDAALPRSMQIEALAQARGWGFDEEDPARAKYFSAYPFISNTPERACDAVWGSIDGRPFETFLLSLSENTYLSGSLGKTRTMSSDFQVTWVPLPGPLPRIKLTLNDSVSQRLAALGEREVDVESYEFNEIWSVYSHDARIAHAILQPRMIERLLESDANCREFTFEGAALMTSVPFATALADVEALVRMLYGVADLVPRFLFEDNSGDQVEGGREAV